MEHLVIRAANKADIPGICRVNRGEDGPWAALDSCASYVESRLRNGFYVQVAEWNGQIVGHGEWVVSDEPRWKTFYLGQLQVDPDFQRRGVGRRMLADGATQARLRGCESVSLIPETDTDSQYFYEKCGFRRGRDIYHCTLPALEGAPGALPGRIAPEVPLAVVKGLPFLFGLSQTASGHMWQVFNRRPADEGRRVDTLAGDGFWLQLGAFRRTDSALLLAWGKQEQAAEIVDAARAFAFALGYPGVSFFFFPELRGCFPENAVEPWTYEMYMTL